MTNHRINNSLVILLCMVIVQGIALGQESSVIFESLRKKFAEAQTIKMNFSERDNSLYRGTLIVKRGNKFIIELTDRMIYCNGSVVWNSLPSKNKVIVSNYVNGEDAVSPETFFLNFPKDYSPSIVKESSSATKNSVVLTLVPNGKKIASLDKIRIWLNPQTLDITQLEITENSTVKTWLIQSVRINSFFSDEAFNYKPPKDFKIIDLR